MYICNYSFLYNSRALGSYLIMQFELVSFFIITALFLALIGIYHEATYPHNFVSLWFFHPIGYFLYSNRYLLIFVKKPIGISIILLMIIIGWMLFFTIPWQSAAENEILGISILNCCVVLHGIPFDIN
ncbi:Protein of unknown function DUF998 [Sulfolobus islandicus M.16.27]|uniref:Uncharacterized protein n=2 Tax=Saccharolobus islandicus TaxID=43080 RepID=C3N447_SACI3|nr:Protein of unknown function DUF998 [Sulfolobus islandicus M.16.27]